MTANRPMTNSKKQEMQQRKELSKERQDGAIQELLKTVIQKGGRELISAIMETVGAYYQADRCYIFEEDPTGRTISNTYEWCAPGVVPEKDNLQDVPIENLNPWLSEFKKRGTFYLTCDDEYAKKEPLIYQVLEPQNIKSLMAAPMVESGLEIGFLGVDNPRENTDHRLYLSVAATSAYHELRSIHEKERLEQARDEAEATHREIEAIHQTLGSGDWKMHFDETGKMLSCSWSPEFRRMLGYQSLEDFPDELESWSDLLVPGDKERTIHHYWDVVNDYTGQKTYNVEYRLITKNRGERWFRAIGRLTRRTDGSPVTFYGIFLDIDDEKRSLLAEKSHYNSIIEAISGEYHTVWYITKADLEMHFLRSSGKTTIQNAVNMGLGNANYDRAMKEYVDTYVLEEDRARVEEATSSAVVREKIKGRPVYTVNYHRRDDAGNVTYHQMAFADADDDFILAYRDIDDMMREELEKERARQNEEAKTTNLVAALSSVYTVVVLADMADGISRPVKMDSASQGMHSGYFAKAGRPYSTKTYVDTYVHPEDRKLFEPVLRIEDCREYFSQHKEYSFNFRSVRDGVVHYVQAQFVRPDADRDELVIGYRNIDEQEAERLEKTRQEHELLGIIEALSSEYVSVYLINKEKDTFRTLRANEVGASVIAE